MRVSGGQGGWLEVRETEAGELGLPGRTYLRIEAIDGCPRVTELYVDGRGEPIQSRALRRFPLSAIETFASGDFWTAWRLRDRAGPDLSRLATTISTTWSRGYFSGRHCDACGAPLRGGSGRSISNWLALSYLSQVTKSVPRPAPFAPHTPEPELLKEPRLEPPQDGLTDAFLSDVTRAYDQAILLRRPPAKAIAHLANVTDRTAQSWIYKARKRRIMPPAAKRGRIV